MIAIKFRNESLLNFCLSQLESQLAPRPGHVLSVSAAYRYLTLETGILNILVTFDYETKHFENCDDFENSEPDPDAQDQIADVLDSLVPR